MTAEVRGLVELSVGVEARLGKVELNIQGVEAQALVKARLDNVSAILDRVLLSLDRNPELLESVGEAVERVGGGTGRLLAESGEAVARRGRGHRGGAARGRWRRGEGVGQIGQGAGQGVLEARREGLTAMATQKSRSKPRRRSSSSNKDGGAGRRASQKPEKYRFAQNVDGGETVAEEIYRKYTEDARKDIGVDPDVLIDVPVVKVDSIHLELDDLQAHVALQAKVLELVKLNVGVDVQLGKVSLDIKGVEAQAVLKVRLDHVTAIVDRVLTTHRSQPRLGQEHRQGGRERRRGHRAHARRVR